ncbi:hypothetical protein ACP70R_010116 [Stipagrostis hirtigluma subsp. patula]
MGTLALSRLMSKKRQRRIQAGLLHRRWIYCFRG